MQDSTVSFLHSGDMGDIVAGLAAVKEFCEKKGVKARILLDTSGALNNPLCNRQSKGLGMKFGKMQAAFLIPLIRAQPFVDYVGVWEGWEKPDCDLNEFRHGFCKPWKYETRKNLLYNHQKVLGIPLRYNGPWLTRPEGPAFASNDVIVARSSRYHSSDQMYKKYMDEIKHGLFIGTDFEYQEFEDCFRFCPECSAHTIGADELAKIICDSKTIFVNGTLAFWIALGLGHPHIIHEVGVNIPSTVFLECVPGLEYWQGGKVRRMEELV